MSKIGIIAKREFMESVQTKTFLVGTLLGPLLIAGFIALQVVILTRIGGGRHSVVVVDQTTEGLGAHVALVLPEIARTVRVGRSMHFETNVIAQPVNLQRVRDSLEARIVDDSLDGYLVLPAGILVGDEANYYGKNATNEVLVGNLRAAVQRTVQSRRLTAAGIDPEKVGPALQPVRLYAEKVGKRGLRGSAEAGRILGFLMGFAIYLVIALYGAAIMNGVLEEKRDKIVEVIVSSVRARELMVGKVLGIAGSGLVQMLVWVTSVALVLAYSSSIAQMLNLNAENAAALMSLTSQLPQVPLSVGLIFVLFFAGGFFIYSTIYATIGSIATTNQEAQQLVFPAIMPLVIGFLMANTALVDPDAPMAVAGSLIPFTSPMVMPIRAAVGSASYLHVGVSFVLLILTSFLMLWLAGKIYRIGIFATGKRPTLKELGRWLRTA